MDGEKLTPTGLSASTVRRVGATLHKALADDKNLIPYNPADAAELPKIERDSDGAGEVKTWTREELDTFLAHVAVDIAAVAAGRVDGHAARRGVRLTWRDVDLEAAMI